MLTNNVDAVSQYRAGKTAAFGFLVGQVMKAAAGQTNPRRVNELLKKALEGCEPRAPARSPPSVATRAILEPFRDI